MLGFEAVQVLLHGSIVNAQELVGGGHHVDAIRFALSTFPVHELVHQLISGRTLEDYTYHQEQRPTQGGRTPLGDTVAADFYLAGLVRRGVNARESHQRLFGVEAAHIANLRHELGAEGRPNAEHPHHNGVLRQRCRQGLHFVPERGQRGGSDSELGHRLLHQELGGIGLGHDAEMPTGGGIDVQGLVLAEVVAMLLAPLLILGCKCLFGQPTDTFTVWESGNKVHPFLTSVSPGRACKQAVRVWKSGVEQGDQIVFKHGLYFGALLVLSVCGFQHKPHLILRDVSGQRQPVVEAVVGQLERVLLIGLGPPQAVVPVAMHQHGVHHGNVKARIVEEAGHRQMVVPRGLHHNTGLVAQFSQPARQLTQLNAGVSHLKRRDHHLSQRTHDGNHALALGNVNAYTVHVHSPNTKFATGIHLFLAADSIYWVTRTHGSTCLNRTPQQEDG